MSWVATAIAGSAILSAVVSSNAADNAAGAQTGAANAGIAAQQGQFAALQEALKPYNTAGTGALTAQQNLLGLNGEGPQQAAYSGIESSPAFKALMQQGESGILQNASATGGLRGGNVQAALGQFRPALLAQLINDQYSKLGGLTAIGQNAAAGVGNAGMQTGANVATLLGNAGSAQAGGYLAGGRAVNGALSGLTNAAGMYYGLGNGAGAGMTAQPVLGAQYGNFQGINPALLTGGG